MGDRSFSFLIGLMILLIASVFVAMAAEEIGLNHYEGTSEVSRTTAIAIAAENVEGTTVIGDSDPVIMTYDFNSKALHAELEYTESEMIAIVMLSLMAAVLALVGITTMFGAGPLAL